MRRLLAQTSPGRILTTFLYPGQVDPLAPTKVWIDRAGMQTIRLGSGEAVPRETEFMSLGGGPEYHKVPASEYSDVTMNTVPLAK
ncbi:hypothetical protein AJ80_09244 [Polytolypa hystricis UAMH7299]|uniref:Uncharacterized protein n=1 Tax=Polytolypa hystricis (strain UAMH7299) TaxID=1447883 RepID=A0A2B7WTX2_POLH7|nr:hypothetical protein AJ80_09244 [Polytolypa hystricis UAMH7299]